MYAKSIRPSAKRNNQIACPRPLFIEIGKKLERVTVIQRYSGINSGSILPASLISFLVQGYVGESTLIN